MIPLGEFPDATGQITVKAGDKVDVYIESRENDDGSSSCPRRRPTR